MASLRDLGYKECPDCNNGMARPGHRICAYCETEERQLWENWTDEDEDALEDYEEDRRRKIAERNEY